MCVPCVRRVTCVACNGWRVSYVMCTMCNAFYVRCVWLSYKWRICVCCHLTFPLTFFESCVYSSFFLVFHKSPPNSLPLVIWDFWSYCVWFGPFVYNYLRGFPVNCLHFYWTQSTCKLNIYNGNSLCHLLTPKRYKSHQTFSVIKMLKMPLKGNCHCLVVTTIAWPKSQRET